MSTSTLNTHSFVSTKLSNATRNHGDAIDIFMAECAPTQAQLDVYQVMVDSAVDYGTNTFVATNAEIAEAAGVHPRTARRILSALSDASLISRRENFEGGQGANTWSVNKVTRTNLSSFNKSITG